LTAVRVRTRATESAGAQGTLLLDWFGGASERTVDCGSTYMAGPRLSAIGEDLLRLGGSIYCADRVVRRAGFNDRWHRDLSLQIGVSDRAAWSAALAPLTEALEFLSGDRWELSLRKSAGPIRQMEDMASQGELSAYDAVCLFSGGLDSLCGAVALLEAGKRVALVGHFENGLAPKRQKLLADRLASRYGAEQSRLFQLHLGPAAQAPHQMRPLPKGADRESSFRARSMLFISAGVALADALGPDVPLYVPENGFIGINVPLRATRAGSRSTRTTHPWFMDRVEESLRVLGVSTPILNPFRTRTKGEVLASVADAEGMEALVPTSLSCSHPESLRNFGFSPQHCGYCFPCLIRQASIYAADMEDRTKYAFDVLRDDRFLAPDTGRAADPMAVLNSLRKPLGRFDVLRNGPVAAADVVDFSDVYRRGREELRSWLSDKGSAKVKAALGD